jgi:hypothetical protein
MRLPGQDFLDRDAVTKLPGQGCNTDCWYKQPKRIERRGNPEKDSQNITANTG